jgi:biopolymer transport protein ExbB/TolQ
MTPVVPVSWGELLDKITILEIKSARLTSGQALANVRNELARLLKVAAAIDRADDEIRDLKVALRQVNETLWEIEDRIRGHEEKKLFDRDFIELARSVYKNNDERGRIKREINRILKSEMIEEKQYKSY